jgi:hypothetical protein
MPPVPDPAAPRSLLWRSLITLAVIAFDLSLLIETLEARAAPAADDPDQIDFGDYLSRRVAELREMTR